MSNDNPGATDFGEVDATVEIYSSFKPIIEWRNVEHLRPNPHNARTHNRKQRRAIETSIRRLGFNCPILIDKINVIVAGHGRWEVAIKIGLNEVPVIVLDHLNPDEIRAFMLADNQLATLAGWDDEILAIELQHLVEMNFNLDVTGFEAPEVDFLIETQLTGPGESRADVIPEVLVNVSPTSRMEDIWILGKHRLMCGSALNYVHLQVLMGEILAVLIFTDPPYNVQVDGHVCGSGAIKHKEFIMASGEMSREEFLAFLTTFLANSSRFILDGAIAYVFMDWRSIDVLLEAGKDVFAELLNICIWAKTNAGMGSLYRSQHEMIAVYKHGTAPHRNNIQLGRFGRNRSNLWTYAGVNTFGSKRLEELSSHPTVKPVALVSDAIRDASKRGDVVLDPFMGSGTTIVAAEETGRVACGMELDPAYVDVAVKRWQDFTGGEAIHAVTGITFDEMTALRNATLPLLPPPSICDEEGPSNE
jgi:DNA modification methylase